MRRAALLPLIVLASCAHAPLREPSVVDFDRRLLDFMGSVQREFSVETVLCLTGRASGDTLHVEDVRLAGVTYATATRAYFEGCRARGMVGFIHNHPNGACQLSVTDSTTMAKGGYRIAVASCTGGFAWRTPNASGIVVWFP